MPLRSSSLRASDLNASLVKMSGWMETLWSGDREECIEAFKAMRAWWKDHAAPVERQRRIEGALPPVVVMGLNIPSEVRDQVIKVKIQNPNVKQREVHYNLLNITVRRKMGSITEWALLGGWNPNYYGALVTPVGQAIYSGDVKGLELMRDFGADLRLELRSEHGTADRPILPDDVGSTALHRVMSKPDQGQKAKIVEILVKEYPDVLPRTQTGLTPLDVALDDEGVNVVRREMARREHLAMTEWARGALAEEPTGARARTRI